MFKDWIYIYIYLYKNNIFETKKIKGLCDLVLAWVPVELLDPSRLISHKHNQLDTRIFRYAAMQLSKIVFVWAVLRTIIDHALGFADRSRR